MGNRAVELPPLPSFELSDDKFIEELKGVLEWLKTIQEALQTGVGNIIACPKYEDCMKSLGCQVETCCREDLLPEVKCTGNEAIEAHIWIFRDFLRHFMEKYKTPEGELLN